MTNLEDWLKQRKVAKNLDDILTAIEDGNTFRDHATGVAVIFTGVPVVQILMPKNNAMALKGTWEAILNQTERFKNKVRFEVSALEDFLP